MAKKKPDGGLEKVEVKIPAKAPEAIDQPQSVGSAQESDLAKHPKFDKFKKHGGN